MEKGRQQRKNRKGKGKTKQTEFDKCQGKTDVE